MPSFSLTFRPPPPPRREIDTGSDGMFGPCHPGGSFGPWPTAVGPRWHVKSVNNLHWGPVWGGQGSLEVTPHMKLWQAAYFPSQLREGECTDFTLNETQAKKKSNKEHQTLTRRRITLVRPLNWQKKCQIVGSPEKKMFWEKWITGLNPTPSNYNCCECTTLKWKSASEMAGE